MPSRNDFCLIKTKLFYLTKQILDDTQTSQDQNAFMTNKSDNKKSIRNTSKAASQDDMTEEIPAPTNTDATKTRDTFQPDAKWLPRIAKFVTAIGRTYNRYEIKGLENIPKQGATLIVLYHGLVPIDYWYFGLELYLKTGRNPVALVDRWLLKTPGLKWLTKAVGGIEANKEEALKLLKEGHLIGVAPGGVKEAIKGSNKNYQLVWGKRKGFAELALAADCPIIPGFTENVEGLYKAPGAGSEFFQNLYAKTKLPIVPIVGLGPLPFPVKLTTWLGEPIQPKANETADELAARTKLAIEKLIAEHQL